MKRIHTIIMLLLAVTTFAQGKSDLKYRTVLMFDNVKKLMANSEIDTSDKAYAGFKFVALEKLDLAIEGDQKKKMLVMFKDQYGPLKAATDKYLQNDKSDGSRLELMKLLIQNEEDFRKMLTPDQLLKYLRYGDNTFLNMIWNMHFMSDDVLNKFKEKVR